MFTVSFLALINAFNLVVWYSLILASQEGQTQIKSIPRGWYFLQVFAVCLGLCGFL